MNPWLALPSRAPETTELPSASETSQASLSVTIVINGLGAGGAERSLAELLPLLSDAGVEVTVVALRRRDVGVEGSVLDSGHDVHFLRARGLVSRTLELRRLIKRRRPDLVHTTLFDSNLVGRLATAGTKVPVLTSLVNTPYGEARLVDPNLNRIKLRVVKSIDGFSARVMTDHFHAITTAVKEDAVATLGIDTDRVTVIPRGRDAHRLGRPSSVRKAKAREGLGLPRSGPLLLNVGRQEHQKGQRYLLEAMPAVLDRHPDATLLVAGRRGNATTELEDLSSKLALGEAIRFLDYRDDVPELLAASDVFVFPSLWEGLGGALIEAMALGLPVIATRLKVFDEVLDEGRNAVLVAPGDPLELARALNLLLDDQSTRERYGDRSRSIFEERFTLESSARDTINLYRRVARGAGSEALAKRDDQAN